MKYGPPSPSIKKVIYKRMGLGSFLTPVGKIRVKEEDLELRKVKPVYNVQLILSTFLKIFAPFGSTKTHSSLPLQISLSTPWTLLLSLD